MPRRLRSSGFPLVACLAFAPSCADSSSPAPRGAASLQWATSMVNSKTPQCVPGPHWTNAPATTSDAPQTTDTATGGGLVVDGVAGAVVTCSVVPAGQAYVVTGEIHATSPDGASFSDIALDVTIDNENEAQGTVYVTDQISQYTFSSDTAIVPPKPGCTFSAHAQNDQLGVAPGRIWVSVQCPHINDNRNRAAQECQIASGFVVLENCLRE